MAIVHDIARDVETRRGAINIVALGTALSVALVVLFVLCVLAALMFPSAPLAHGWVALFSLQPMGSAANWIAGILGSIAFGWITAVVLGLVYNRMEQ